jgi:zinc protease
MYFEHKASLAPMRKIILAIAIPAVALVLLQCSSAPQPHTTPSQASTAQELQPSHSALPQQSQQTTVPAHYSHITFDSLQYHTPNPLDYRVEISSSVVAYLYPSQELPLIKLNMLIPRNNYAQTPQQTALHTLLSSMYRRGGSQNLSAEALDDTLDFLSAHISGGFSDEYSSISVNALARDFKNITTIAKDVFLKPALDSARLQVQKKQIVQSLQHRYDTPTALLSDLNSFATYQPGPHTWVPSITDIQQITRDSLQVRASIPFAAPKIILGVSGQFHADSMKLFLQQTFADWPGSTDIAPKPVAQFKNNAGKIFLSPKSIKQANIQMTAPFVQRPHPDYYAASLANYIIGGGSFTSRLTKKVRSDEGLAYSVFSYTGSSYTQVSTCGIKLQTKVESAAYALKLIEQELLLFIQNGPTEQELENAKQSLIASLPSLFNTPSSTVDAFVMSELWGRDFDHFVQYPQKLQAITAQQVQQAAQKYFHPSRMTTSIVGPQQALLAQDTQHNIHLDSLGTVIIVAEEELTLR